jgi:hypothetical protein
VRCWRLGGDGDGEAKDCAVLKVAMSAQSAKIDWLATPQS